MRSGWLVLACSMAFALGDSVARADMIHPPPEECPDGSRPTSTHAGPHCAPFDCEHGDACDEGLECRRVALCVVVRNYASRAGPSSTRVIEGPCPDGSCATGACELMPVCVSNAGTGGREERPAPSPAPVPAPTESAAPEPDTANQAPPARAGAEPPAPPRDRRLGWWRVVPVLLAALVLAVWAALALARRKH